MSSNRTQTEKEQQAITNLLMAQEEGRVPSTCLYKHHIHTPFALCGEILDKIKIPPVSKVLVMFNLEFLYTASKRVDFSLDDVYYYTTDKVKARLAKLLIPGVEVINELDDGMKFNVIVGNPPYQSGKGNSDKLWPMFIEKCISMTAVDGFVSLVCPDTWTSGTESVCLTGRKNILSDLLLTNNPTIFNFNVGYHFSGIGSSFSYFVVQRAPYCGITRIITESTNFTTDLTGFRCLLRNPTKKSLAIAAKVFNSGGTPFKFKFVDGRDIEYTEFKDKDHPHFFYNANSNRKDMWGNRRNGPSIAKIHLRYLGTNFAFDYDIAGNINVMHNGRVWPIPEGVVTSVDFCKSVFESKLFKFLVYNNKWGQYNEPKILNQIPVIDLSRAWTDKELYDHFGLTEEERLYIDPSYKA